MRGRRRGLVCLYKQLDYDDFSGTRPIGNLVELAPWGQVLSEYGLVLAWVPQPDWESSPEYRWVRSRVDELESRATSMIEQAGLPD
jgi:hypothetical protein